jgi:nucleotide-binding universal stress UspA family protein
MVASRTVVVGVDGSPSSIHALRWACHQHRPGDRIEAVMTWHDSGTALSSPLVGAAVPPPTLTADDAAQALAGFVADVRAEYDTAFVEVVSHGPAGMSLLEAADQADLLVVGRRSNNLARLLLGSVSRRVLHHAEVPVVVVPEGAPLDYSAHVVVGVDGSDNATAALRWSLDLDTERIDVVHTWDTPGPYPWFVDAVFMKEQEPLAESVCERVISQALNGATDERVVGSVREGDARTLLVDEEPRPGLIVVGSRGHTGLSGMLVGSVATYVATHADVAVAVVPTNAAPQ